MNIRAYYRLRLLDKNGREVRRGRWRRSRSFVLQFLQFLHGDWDYIAETGVTDTGGTDRTLRAPGTGVTFFRIDGTAGSALFGTVVGTGTTAVAMTDYALATLIAHGTGSGQLSYGACTMLAVSQSGDDADVQVTRTFTNGSGAQITVKETGIYFYALDSGGDPKYFCMVRDVLTSTVDVPDGQSLAVDYTIKISV